jgi:hypothetical protein
LRAVISIRGPSIGSERANPEGRLNYYPL